MRNTRAPDEVIRDLERVGHEHGLLAQRHVLFDWSNELCSAERGDIAAWFGKRSRRSFTGSEVARLIRNLPAAQEADAAAAVSRLSVGEYKPPEWDSFLKGPAGK